MKKVAAVVTRARCELIDPNPLARDPRTHPVKRFYLRSEDGSEVECDMAEHDSYLPLTSRVDVGVREIVRLLRSESRTP